MNRSVVLALLLVGAAFAGCVGGSDSSGDQAETASESGPQADDSNETAGDGGHHQSATLEEPPEWTVGQFWTVEITPGSTGETMEITRVVADKQGSTYRVGMPSGVFSHEAIVAHFPGMGNVQADTLGFAVHGEQFKPLDFPLEQDKTWTTNLYEMEFEATVTETTESTATVEMSSESNSTVELTYDASVQAITDFSGPLGAEMTVTSHDHGYEGDVVVPYDREQFIDGRIVGAIDLNLQPAPPTGSVEVGQKFDQASFAQLVGNAQIAPAQPGVYREVTTDPGGNSTETTFTQTSGGFQTVFGSSTAPSGEWTFEHVAGGVGVAATEIIAYQIQKAELSPDTGASGATNTTAQVR